MRLIYLAPGSGDNFYCENCLRDHAVVKGLTMLGHQAMVVPLYLPTGVSDGHTPIFFGGLNVYLQQHAALFRHTPRWLDRWLDHPRLLAGVGRLSGMTDNRDLGPLTLSMLRGEQGHQVKELDRLVAFLSEGPPPDAVILSSALLVGVARRLRAALGCPVQVHCQGEAGFIDAMPPRWRSACWRELRQRCAEVDGLLTVSAYYAGLMATRLGLPPGRFQVVHPGLDLSAYSPPPSPALPPAIGYLSRLCPAKGLERVVGAFCDLARRPGMEAVQLHLAGGRLAVDEPFIRRQVRRLRAAGLLSRLRLRSASGTQERIAFLRQLRLLSVPEVEPEGYGLYMLEAAACGVLTVQDHHGPFAEILTRVPSGQLCHTADPQDLADAWQQLLEDPQTCQRLRHQGLEAVQAYAGLEAYAARFAAAIASVIGG